MSVEEFPEIRDYAKTLPHVRVTGLDVYGAIFRRSREHVQSSALANALYEGYEKATLKRRQIQYLSMGMTQ